MPSHARVLVIDDLPSRALAVAGVVGDSGYAAWHATADEEPLRAVHDRHPDLVLINSDLGEPYALTRSIKANAEIGHTPVVMFASDDSLDIRARALDSGADDVVSLAAGNALLLSRVRALTRRHTMYTELLRRRDAVARFGIEVPSTPIEEVVTDGARVLMVTAESSGVSVESLLDDRFLLDVVDTPAAAVDRLAADRFDAVVMDVDRDELDRSMTLYRDIRSNPGLFHLPVVVVAEVDAFQTLDPIFQLGVSDVVFKPARGEELRQRTLALIRQLRFRYMLHGVCQQVPHLVTVDQLTGLYTYGFLFDYLGSLIRESAEYGKEFSVGFFDIGGMERINRQFGYAAGDQLLRQVGQMIARLVRVEDLAARYGGEEFCVVLPDTPAAVSTPVLARIGGVIGHTEFLIDSAAPPMSIVLKGGVADYRRGDTAERLVARARDGIA